jgi:hypothetical protein
VPAPPAASLADRLAHEQTATIVVSRALADDLTPAAPRSGRSGPWRGPRTPRAVTTGATVAGRYELRDKLGTGGFGTVYRAQDTLSGRQVAVKLLSQRGEEDLQLFRRETGTLRMLRLPGVVPFLDDGVHDGGPFLVTEIIEGRAFPGPAGSSWDTLEPTVAAFLEALDRVHTHGIIHRDLKPANVLVSPDGVPTLLDFGVSVQRTARRDAPAEVCMGTPVYMSPEQLCGRPATIRSDLYAVGVMLYCVLCGALPFHSRAASRLVAEKFDPLPPIKLRIRAPREVVELVRALTEARPADRPHSAAEALAALGFQRPVPAPLRAVTELRTAVDETALRALFHGPELGFHLPSDGAAILHRRTGGDSARIAAELEAWTRAGLAYWDGDKVRVTRESLDRLDGAERFPPAEGVSDHDRIRDAIDQAATTRREGRIGPARYLIESALHLARSTGDHEGEVGALVELTKLTCLASAVSETDLAIWELTRGPENVPMLGACEQLLRVLRSSATGDQPDLLMKRAQALPAFSDVELEIERQSAILLCANRQSFEAYQATADALVRWADASLPPDAAAGVRSWTGYSAYRAGDFEASAAIYLQATGPEIPPRFRLAAIRNAVMALCETPRLKDALALAREGIGLAAALRRVSSEVILSSSVDAIKYRLGHMQQHSPELAEAHRLINEASLTGVALVTQAAIAWRNGDLRTARALALESAENFRAASIHFAATLAHALACAAGDFVTEEDVERWMTDALAGPPNVARQAAALFAMGGVPWTGPVPDPPAFALDGRRAEVLTNEEVVRTLGATRHRTATSPRTDLP